MIQPFVVPCYQLLTFHINFTLAHLQAARVSPSKTLPTMTDFPFRPSRRKLTVSPATCICLDAATLQQNFHMDFLLFSVPVMLLFEELLPLAKGCG